MRVSGTESGLEFTEVEAGVQLLPPHYVNKRGVLAECGAYVSEYGKRCLVTGGERALGAAGGSIEETLGRSRITYKVHHFRGECSLDNLALIAEKARTVGADVIVGVGGGKALDAAKAAANAQRLPILCVPTIASTCAATSPGVVLYDADGRFLRSLYFTNAPEMVLVDPEIIANAPVEYYTPGILDGLSKWYELKPIFDRIESPDHHTRTAMHLSSLLRDVVYAKGPAAVQAVRCNEATQEMMDVVDTSIYLTGVIKCFSLLTLTIGIAHAVHNGLSHIKEAHEQLHGMKVGYGMAVQLAVLHSSDGEITPALDLFRDIGFIPSLHSLDVPATAEYMERIIDHCIDDAGVKRMPVSVDRAVLREAMERVEELAQVCSDR